MGFPSLKDSAVQSLRDKGDIPHKNLLFFQNYTFQINYTIIHIIQYLHSLKERVKQPINIEFKSKKKKIIRSLLSARYGTRYLGTKEYRTGEVAASIEVTNSPLGEADNKTDN